MNDDLENVDFENLSDEEFDAYLEGIKSDADEADILPADNEPDVVEGLTESGRAEAESEEVSDEEEAIADESAAASPMLSEEGKSEFSPRLNERLKKMYPDLSAEEALEVFLDRFDEDDAKKAGLDLESYKKQEDERREFEEFKADKVKRQESEDAKSEVINRWKADSEWLRQVVPGFDFNKAMENGQFRDKVLREGKDVKTAYFELNPINKAKETGSKRRDVEGALQGGYAGNGTGEPDFAGMASKDFKAVLDELYNKQR